MTLSEELKWRGFLNQTTFKEISDLDDKKGTFYHGYDASADSLTIGNLAAVMLDRLFIRHGWRAIIVLGGATSMIGDPGGKDKERALLNGREVNKNIKAVGEQLNALFSDLKEVEILNNQDWFKNRKWPTKVADEEKADLSLLSFLRDVGKHFSMSSLVQRDYIAKRIGEGGSGMSFTEFSYTLLQAYDFLKLHEVKGVNLQLAGSDQWGNCISGVDLIRRVSGHHVNVITMPLIVNKTTGKKFGKSEEGAVWLDKKKTLAENFFQFWVNLDDEGVEDYLKIFTELSKEEITSTMKEFEKNKASRSAQRKLAEEVTRIVHGNEAVQQAKKHATTISTSSSSSSTSSTSSSTTSTTTSTTTLPPDISISKDGDIVTALVNSGLASSKREARQLLESGGVYVNGKQTTKQYFEPDDARDGLILLRRGKTLKNTVIIRLQ